MDCCSLIIRASQFSSTTRNLVPRFKEWSKGERLYKDGVQHKICTCGYLDKCGIEASLELKFKKFIESKVRRSNKKLQPGRQSFDVWNTGWKGFKASRISIASNTRTDHKKLARELHTKPSAGNNFGSQRCTGESGFDLVELWALGPPCAFKARRHYILHDHDSKVGQRTTCQLCWP